MLNGALETLPDFIRTTLLFPHALASLDLSFNVFTEIPTVRKYQMKNFNDIYKSLTQILQIGSNRCH
jgi:hypothetical protein